MEYLLPDLQRAGAPTLGVLAGVVLIGTALFEAFEIIVLPRRASGRLGVARFFYILTWRPYSAIARRLKNTSRRESLLSLYGPSFLLLLVGVWAAILVLGFAMLHCAVGSVSRPTCRYSINAPGRRQPPPSSFAATWVAPT